MSKARKQMIIISFFAILVLYFLFGNRAESQSIPLQDEAAKGHPKIESVLTQLMEQRARGGIALSQEFAKGRRIKLDQEGMITVYLLPEAGKTKDTIDVEALGAYGGEVIKSGDYVVEVRVPISELEDIADKVKGISFINLPDKAHADVISQGVSLTGAPTYYSSGYTGQDVKVAIIDVGFAGLSSAISNGVLPNNLLVYDCTGSSCVQESYSWDLSETDYHGTAVAEIVHDMAPSAQLYLMKVAHSLDLKQAKDLCRANGITIVNHSVSWFNTNFYDGSCYNDNPVCTATNAFNSGILWLNAAGNFAKQHYEAIFSDPDGNGWHNVSGSNECVNITASSGDTIIVELTWNAWPATNQDYDLYLFYNGSSGLTKIDWSTNRQTGSQLPTESISYPVTTAGNYCVSIKKYSATANNKLQLLSLNHDLSPYVPSSSILSPADASGAMAVAAIDWHKWTTGPQEIFSSQGPTTDGRIKPDISGPDNVSNYIFGLSPLMAFAGQAFMHRSQSGIQRSVSNKGSGSKDWLVRTEARLTRFPNSCVRSSVFFPREPRPAKTAACLCERSPRPSCLSASQYI